MEAEPSQAQPKYKMNRTSVSSKSSRLLKSRVFLIFFLLRMNLTHGNRRACLRASNSPQQSEETSLLWSCICSLSFDHPRYTKSSLVHPFTEVKPQARARLAASPPMVCRFPGTCVPDFMHSQAHVPWTSLVCFVLLLHNQNT